MKIFMADTENGRFSHYMRDHWIKKGHDVSWRGGYDPSLADLADLIYVEWTDMNIQLISKQKWFNTGEWFDRPILNRDKKKVVNRMIDIDMWAGHGGGVNWDGVDDLIFIAPHIQKLANERFAPENIQNCKQHLIQPGVDLDYWTFRDRKPGKTKNICFFGELWENKGIDRALRIFIELLKRDPKTDWQMHLKGTWPNNGYFYYYNQNLIDKTGIRDRLHFYEDHIEDLNEWYEQMDYLLMASIKEAFSYVTAETMAKGIKPIINNFFGSDDIWPAKYIFNTECEAVDALLREDYDSSEYRTLIEEKYDLKRMLADFDRVCGT